MILIQRKIYISATGYKLLLLLLFPYNT